MQKKLSRKNEKKCKNIFICRLDVHIFVRQNLV